MPISRHGRGRRAPLEDDIEEAPTQRSVKDEVDDGDDDDRPPRRGGSKAVKTEKQKKQRNQPTTSQIVEEGNEEEEEGVDEDPLATLGDQPLDKASGAKVSGLAQDWEQVLKMGIRQFYGPMKSLAADMAEFAGDDSEEVLEELDGMVKKLIDIENEVSIHQKTLQDMCRGINQGQAVSGVVKTYQTGVQGKLSEYKSKTSRQKYAKHEEYSGFRQAIFEVKNPDAPMPPVTEFIPKERGDDSDEDEDVEIGGVTQDYRCPITLTIMVNPLTSSICGHSFSSDAIRQYLTSAGNARRKKCPTTGCNKEISLADLKPNPELAKKAKEAKRRERMREEDEGSGDDEVVV